MTANPNSYEALKPLLSAQALQDIEGLDPEKMGFCREECCGGVPEKLRGSMKLKEHVFLCTQMHATQWTPRSDNIPGFQAMNENMRTNLADATFTAAQAVLPDEEESVLRFKADDHTGRVTITQYSTNPEGDLPWEKRGTLSVDRSDDTFVFVCAHHARDARCGFCGTVLVDLFRQTIAKTLGPEKTAHVSVHPCGHVGGHIYAGNVIVYNKYGGVCYGLFMPTDIATVVKGLAERPDEIPSSLVSRIRGQLGSLRRPSSRTVPINLSSPATWATILAVGAGVVGAMIYVARSKL